MPAASMPSRVVAAELRTLDARKLCQRPALVVR
jgi:hypothetical protein